MAGTATWVGTSPTVEVSDNNWSTTTNWKPTHLPENGSIALFDDTNLSGVATVDIKDAVASCLNFDASLFILNSESYDPSLYLLTLFPNGGTAIVFTGTSTTIDRLPINITPGQNGTIILGEHSSTILSNDTHISGSGSILSITGNGELANNSADIIGASSTNCSLNIFGGSITNHAYIGYPKGATLHEVNFAQTNLLNTNSFATTADSIPNSIIGTISVESGTITNSYYFAVAESAGYIENIAISNASITNQNRLATSKEGSAIGTITVSGGSIFNNNNIYSWFANSENGTINHLIINGGYIFSDGFIADARGGTINTLTISDDVVIDNQGFFAQTVDGFIGTITVSGGSITSSGAFAVSQGAPDLNIIGNFIMTGGTINSSGKMGAAPFNISGGSITNDYLFSLTGNSSLTGTTFNGIGYLYIAGTTVINMPISQTSVTVGEQLFGGSPSTGSWSLGAATGNLFASNTITADLVITGSGSFSPGPNSTTCGTLYVNGGVTFENSSIFNISLNGANVDKLVIDGDLNLIDDVTLNIDTVTNRPGVLTEYVFATFNKISGGSFSTFTYPTNLGDIYTVVINPQNAILIANFPSNSIPVPSPSQGGGNRSTAVQNLNTIVATGNCSTATVALFDTIAAMEPTEQSEATAQIPPQFKVIQFSLEKLNFLLQKELDDELYTFDKRMRPFAFAGYDNLDQKSVGFYNGYRVDSWYQMAGFTQGLEKLQWMLAAGASESTMHLLSAPVLNIIHQIGKSTYNTVYGTLGIASQGTKWAYGIKALYGYSFINAQRELTFLNETASNKHNAWNVSGQAHLAYKIDTKQCDFQGYDTLDYLYGVEKPYSETGAPGANMKVKDETLSVIRNALGLKVEGPSGAKIQAFADLAWVYEHYLKSNVYMAAFVGSTLYAPYTQTEPTKNYARVSAGLKGSKERLDWQVSYFGLYGSKFIEQSGSIKLGYRF